MPSVLRKRKPVSSQAGAVPGSPLAVTFVYPTDPRGVKVGGVETFIRSFLELAPTEVEARLVGIDTAGDLACGTWQTVTVSDRPVLFFPAFFEKHQANRRHPVPLSLRFALQLWCFRRRLAVDNSVLSVHRVELSWPFWGHPRLVLFIHGASKFLSLPSESRLRWIRPFFASVEARALEKARRAVVVSQEGLDYYRNRFPGLNGKMRLISNWVDTQTFYPRNKAALRRKFQIPLHVPVVAFVGRFEKVKDPELLLAVFARIKAEFPKALLVVCGAGEEVRGQIPRELQVAVRLYGAVPHQALAEILGCADLFLLTSFFEGMSRAVLESLACGVPVVATDVGDIRKVVSNNLSGSVANSRSPEELAARGVAVLQNESITAKSCVAAIRGFTAPETIGRIVALHREVANGQE